ncbi:hypothetical protein DAETH_25520 [Deinococcus aetherius]|uniref:Uncharacterized protein n=1 Tax=Deinococcus aetherius TaxID=200252 RepID=A0ABM8AFY4_9DEIO|nr:hypothetical protein [Deinococcus aetherius]BDP42583.1 hypothetical protein DAETH_25520 [Deinococcus aetherius]
MRAFRHLFGHRPELQTQPTDSLEQVVLAAPVAQFLLRQAQLRSETRSGLLFGRLQQGTLTLTLATAARWPGLTSDPFHVERAYLLGASDAVGFAFGGQVDWWGLWITGADGQAGPTRRVLRWYERAVRRGLIDDRTVLVVAGFQDGLLSTRTLTGGPGVDPLDLPTSWE